MDGPVNHAIAFGAGVASFIAPCTLALVPAFMAYVAGLSLGDPARQGGRRARVTALFNTLMFVAGFTAVFVLLGSSLGALSQSLSDHAIWLNRIGGTLIIGLGLISLGLVRFSILERAHAPRFDWAGRIHYVGSLAVGATFAIGWVPCVGPILAAILVLAGTSQSVAEGATLLLAYSLGMMLPFLAAGVSAGWIRPLLERYGRALQYTNVAGGLLIVALGIVVFTNLMPVIAGFIPLGTTPTA